MLYSQSKDTLAQILNSIALEEISQSEQIDAEANKILDFVEICNKDNFKIKNIISINQSVGSTLQKIIQLQMQHQLILTGIKENVNATGNTTIPDIEKHLDSTETGGKPKYTYTKQTGIKENVNATGNTLALDIEKHLDSTNAEKNPNYMYTEQSCNCCLKGRGLGNIQYQHDPFHEGIAIIQTFVCSKGESLEDNFLCYSVHKGTSMEILKADPGSFKLNCSFTKDVKKVVLEGEGIIIRKERFELDKYDAGRFELIVVYSGFEFTEGSFEMRIKASTNSAYDQYSGKISLSDSKLIIEAY